MPAMKVREYARHRGVSHVSVLKAIESGRLSKSVTYDAKTRPVIDSDLADAEWLPSTKEMSKAEPALDFDESKDSEIEGIDKRKAIEQMAKARAVRENYQARLAKLEYRERSGKLLPAEEVMKEWSRNASIVRTKIMGIPAKARQRIPELSADEYAVLEAIVRGALEDLADGID